MITIKEICIFIGSVISLACLSALADYYPSFTVLRQDLNVKDNRDYSILIEDKKSAVTAMAIHGGIIEPKSDIIAEIYARRFQHNLYVFRSFSKGPVNKSNYLHVTSTHFDDPDLLKLTRRSRFCASFHGHSMTEPVLCVGGASKKLRQKFINNLIHYDVPQQLGIIVDGNGDGKGFIYPKCNKLRGESIKNVVNTCGEGVQLEMSKAVRDKLVNPNNAELFNVFLKALDETLRD